MIQISPAASRRKNKRTYYEFSDSGFIAKPSKDIETHTYIWDGISVVDSPKKGKSLIATQPLPVDFMIPYGGIHINDELYADKLSENYSTNSDLTHYVIDSTYDEHYQSITYLDAHLRYYPKDNFGNAWIGSLVNEPSVGELPNAKLIWIDPKSTKFPKYPLMCKKMNVFIQLLRNVDTGEELMTDYGYTEDVYENLNYESYKYPRNKQKAMERRPRKPIDYVAMHMHLIK